MKTPGFRRGKRARGKGPVGAEGGFDMFARKQKPRFQAGNGRCKGLSDTDCNHSRMVGWTGIADNGCGIIPDEQGNREISKPPRSKVGGIARNLREESQ